MIGANGRTPQGGQRRSYDRRTMTPNLGTRRDDRRRSRRVSGALLVALAGVVAAACGHRRATPPAAALLPPPVREAGPTYRIQLGDELDEIAVVGMTPSELEQLIIERSSAHLRNPEVSVIVTKLGEQRVYIGGEVTRPGYVVLAADMTPLQAVLQCGGFKKSAKLESVLLLTPGTDGKFNAARVDMGQVVNRGVPERVRLHPNDVVYVPPTWISDMDDVVDAYVRGLIPALPRVGVGYSLQ
ncbi:MAG: hypothetical protein E6J75_02865 [Deltaproteobacteria bacterium]|nr:MAG: hypothetical protein E6J75_02865 [Deltaproteobacteria bacterium]